MYFQDMITVLIADDHQVLLDGLVAIIDKVDDIEVIATANNGKTVLDFLDEEPIDIVILDINMPILNGVETCKKITSKFPNVKVIAFSMHKKPSFINRMIQYGAKGYILKDDTGDHILAGIRAVAGGNRYFSPRIADIVLSGKKESKTELEVSTREIEVLRLISRGMTNQEIATKLFLSPHTTESHRRNLLEKLGARNTADLVRLGLEKGYI